MQSLCDLRNVTFLDSETELTFPNRMHMNKVTVQYEGYEVETTLTCFMNETAYTYLCYRYLQ